MIGFKSIKSRILAFAVMATLVPSLGLGLLTYSSYQAVVSDHAEVELRTLASFARSELDLWVETRIADLHTLASANTVLEGLATSAGQSAEQLSLRALELEIYLRSVQGRLGSILELTLLDRDATTIASSAARPEPVAAPGSFSGRVDTADVVRLPPRWDSERATATLTVLVPILSLRNDFLGSLRAVLDLGRLQPRLQRITESSTVNVLLLAPDGSPLLGTKGGTAALTPIDAQALRRMRMHPGELTTYLGHRRREVFGLVGAPGASSISIVAEKDGDDLYLERRRLLALFAGLACASTLLVGALAYWVGRSIVSPLDGLVHAVDRIADGDLGVHLKSLGNSEIGRLTRAMNTMVDRLRSSHDEVEEAKLALQRQNHLLEELSVTDGLTGLKNRKKLDSILTEQLALFGRFRRPFALLMLDLDHFKALNDTHGHLAGDHVLANVAGILRRCVRGVDFVARYGGEEFAIVLVNATLEGAMDTAERIRSAVQESRVAVDDRQLSVTLSVGVTRSRDGDTRPEDVLARADGALYEAKRAGRNRVHCADLPRGGQD